MSIGTNYDAANAEFLMKYYAKYGEAKPMKNASNDSIFYQAQAAENKCTDGEDDGKINPLSAAGNALEGVWDMGVNLVKTAIKHPLKTAAMIGLCCIPVVGPAIGAGMAAYGLYQGGKQVVNAWQVSQNATTDAEAKAAWENVGAGVGTVALSAAGLKGSVGALKGQLTGGSTTVQAVKNMKGSPKSELVKTAVSEGIKETAYNASQVAQAGIQKATKAFEKGKQYWQAGKNGNLAQTVGDDVALVADKAGNWAGRKAGQAEKFYKDHFTKKGRATAKENLNRLNEAAGKTGSNVIKQNNKFYETLDDGTIVEYNFKGTEVNRTTSTVGANVGDVTKTTKYPNGKEVIETTKYVNGKKVVETKTTHKGITTTKTTKFDQTGKQTSSTTTVYNEKTGIETIKSSDGTSSRMNTNTGETVATKKTGMLKKETTYMDATTGETLVDPTLAQKANMYKQTSGNYHKVNQVIDYQLPGLGENTNEFLMFMQLLDDIE